MKVNKNNIIKFKLDNNNVFTIPIKTIIKEEPMLSKIYGYPISPIIPQL